MFKFGVFILLLAISCQVLAAPTTQLFLNPYYPEFTQNDEELYRSLMDAGLETEITQYMQRRDRLQQLMIEQTPDYAGLLQKDSFVMKRFMDRGARRAMPLPSPQPDDSTSGPPSAVQCCGCRCAGRRRRSRAARHRGTDAGRAFASGRCCCACRSSCGQDSGRDGFGKAPL